MTPRDVLAYLNADCRLRSGFDPEASEGVALTATTTIAEWRSACDLGAVRKLASALPAWFGISASSDECLSILTPERDRTLGDLSAFVAERATRPGFQPLLTAGQSNAGAGAFLSLRGYLARAGVSVTDLHPSTPIASLSSKQLRYVLEAASGMAPDIVPVPTVIHTLRQRIGSWLVILGVLATLIALMSDADRSAYVGAALGVIVGLILNQGRPAAVTLGSYATVGDLATAAAEFRSTSQTVQLDLPFIAEAAAEAIDLGHPYLAPEHLLLAVVAAGHGATGVFCRNHGLDASRLRDSLVDVIGPTPHPTSHVPRLAQRSLVALSQAIQNGRGKSDLAYTSDDLFLSLLTEEVASGAVIGTLLERHGLTPRTASREMLQLRRNTPG